MTGVETLQTIENISEQLNLPEIKVREVLNFLESIGLKNLKMSFEELYEYEVTGCGTKRAYEGCFYEWFIPIPIWCKSQHFPEKALFTPAEIAHEYSGRSKVVIVTHPECGFSENALTNLPNEVRLYLIENGVFVVPISEKSKEKQIQSVKALHNKTAITFLPILRPTNLPQIDLESVPQFFFFEKGTLQSKIIGWPKDNSNLPKLEAAIKQHQLIK